MMVFPLFNTQAIGVHKLYIMTYKYTFLVGAFLVLAGSLCLTACSPRAAQQGEEQASGIYTIKSPAQNIVVQFTLSPEGGAFYNITHNDSLVLQESKLGLIREDADFSNGLTLLEATGSEEVSDQYQILTAKRKNNTYKANKRTFHLANAAGHKMDVIFQISDDGVAFRYYFPEQSAEVKKINREVSSFKFPPMAKAWLQPMSQAKTGWESTNPSYEEHYEQNIAVGTPSTIGAGWVFPALFQSNGSWLLLTESGPEGDYCGTRLHHESSDGEYSIAFPQAAENQPGGILTPQSILPWSTPWRIITVGSLKTIAESTLGTDLAAPAVRMDASFIKPGQASWSWVILKDDSTVYDVQKRFIDFAGDMKWRYCLVDADWDRKIGYEKIAELSRYAQSKGVGLLLWYNSAGSWNTTPYTPKSKLLTQKDRMAEFKKISDMGIAGIKVDFFGGDGQSVMAYYTDILKDAAANKLLVNFHGSTMPRGWHRTYPNLMTMEAIKGMEFITFTQETADLAPNHSAMLPFTRNAFDPMDFTPMNLTVVPGIERKTTSAFELALPVVFLSGIQHFAETPVGMAQVPAFVKEYLKEIPEVWEDTRFVEGYPGKLAVIARKAGNKWYVAGINGEATDKTLSLDLSFIGNKEGRLITDGAQKLSFTSSTVTAGNNTKNEIRLKPNGGFVMIF
jgi:alpha-glucosidase